MDKFKITALGALISSSLLLSLHYAFNSQLEMALIGTLSFIAWVYILVKSLD